MVSKSPSSKDEIEMGNILFTDDASFSVNSGLSSSGCAIDLDPLLRQTEETQKQLKDYSLVLNPEKLKAVLTIWAAELNQTLVAYHRELYIQQAKRRSLEPASGETDGNRSSKEEMDNLKNVEKESDKVSANTNAGRGGDPSSDVDPEMNGNTADLEMGTKEVSVQDRHRIGSQSVDASEQFKTKGSGEGGVDPSANNGCESGEGITVIHNGSDLDTDPTVSRNHSTSLEINVPGNPKENSTKQDIPENPSSQSPNSLNIPASIEGVPEKSRHIVETSGGKSPESDIKGGDFADAENDSEVDLRIDWSQVCHVKDPFQLTPQQHTTICGLVSRCLESGCFGNASTIFCLHTSGPKTISARDRASKEVPSSFKSFLDAYSSFPSQAEKVTQQKKAAFQDSKSNSTRGQHSNAISDVEPLSSSSGVEDSQSDTPAVGGEARAERKYVTPRDPAENLTSPTPVQYLDRGTSRKSAEQEERGRDPKNSRAAPKDCGDRGAGAFDEERALFVRLYYHFLPHWRLRRLLADADGKSVYATWCAVVTCCQGNGLLNPLSLKFL